MCVAELNVSLLPCQHRWFHLVRSCTPSSNLANCSSKLAISGWEIKCEFCPFCSEWNVADSDYRLLGNDRTPTIGGLSRTLSLSLSATRHESRRGSLSRTDSSTSITMAAAMEKNKAMNARVDAYFRVPPPETSSKPAPLQEAEDEGDMAIAMTPSDTASSASEGQESLRQAPSAHAASPSFLKRMRRKSKRVSLFMFK